MKCKLCFRSPDKPGPTLCSIRALHRHVARRHGSPDHSSLAEAGLEKFARASRKYWRQALPVKGTKPATPPKQKKIPELRLVKGK